MPDEIELLRLFRDEMPGPSTDAWARARAAIAAARSEEEPARVRNGKRPGRRRLLAVAVVAGVAAAVAVLLAVLLPGSPGTGPGSPQIRTAAYVISRVQQALAVSGKDNQVGYSRTVFPHGATVTVGLTSVSIQTGPGASSPHSIGTVAEWWYRGTGKTSAYTATGQPVLKVKNTTAVGGQATTVAVNYRDATWWRATSQVPPAAAAPAPRGCGGPGIDVGPGGWPAFIRYQLSCGGYTAGGRQRIDGVSAIKITGGKGLTVLWVNPATYLPVRVVSGGQQPIQTDFRWLPPTPGHLAQLSLPVPAGFRQVPPPS
jgi:hypothetical protein